MGKSEIIKMEQEVLKQIKLYRERDNISQSKVSFDLGYKSNQFALIESGKTRLTVDLLSRLNEIYGWEFKLSKELETIKNK